MTQRVKLWVFCSVVLIVIGLGASLAWARCGAGFCPIARNPEGLGQGFLRLDLSYEYIDQATPLHGDDRSDGLQPGIHRELRTLNSIIRLKGEYGATDRLTLSLDLPFVRRIHDEVVHEAIFVKNDLEAIGDLTLLAKYAVLASPNPAKPRLSLGVGIKFPTGPTDLVNPEVEHVAEVANPGTPGEVVEVFVVPDRAQRASQPGTGSWDPIFGLYYIQSLSPLTLFAEATYRISTGHAGYKFGDQLLANVGASYPLTRRLSAVTQFNLLVDGRDEERGLPARRFNSGQELIFASPGLQFNVTDQLRAYVFGQLPLHRRVNGVQLVQDWAIVAGVTYQFDLLGRNHKAAAAVEGTERVAASAPPLPEEPSPLKEEIKTLKERIEVLERKLAEQEKGRVALSP